MLLSHWQETDTGNCIQVGSDVEQGLGSMASLQAVSEEEWHEEVANLSPKQLVEATFQRLFPESFLYALPVWKHKVVLLPLRALHPACLKRQGVGCLLQWHASQAIFIMPHCSRLPSGIEPISLLGTERWQHSWQAVDELLWKWDTAYGRLHAAEAAYEASRCQKRPAHHLKKWRRRGALMASALATRLQKHIHNLGGSIHNCKQVLVSSSVA